MKIVLRKRNQAQMLIDVILFLPFLFATLIDLFHLPGAVKYVCDIAWVFSLVLLRVQKKKPSIALHRFMVAIVAYLLLTMVLYLFHMQSPLYYIWGVRNNFRFYVAFIICAYFLSEEDIARYLKVFDLIFWINFPICLVQYLLLGKQQDYLGGIFGVQSGCNGYMNIFFVIVITKSIIFYLHKMESTSQCVAKCICALLLAALAELKFFYVELIVIIVFATLFTDFLWKKVGVIFGGLVAILLSASLLGKLFPEFNGFLSVGAILSNATNSKGYTSRGSLNRLTVIPQISERFLTTPFSKIVGLGLGNCDVASYSFLTTPFYTRYRHLRYSWFSTAFTFLETGYIGLLFFFGFFVVVFFVARKQGKMSNTENGKIYCQMAAIISICAVMIGIYNSSLRTEAAYMLYFILSFPLVVGKRKA